MHTALSPLFACDLNIGNLITAEVGPVLVLPVLQAPSQCAFMII
jgi:hypothetical protein